MSMQAKKSFDFVVKSAMVLNERPNKGLEGVLAATPHQMNRLTGQLIDGRKVVIAQRPGKGGMEFNKLLNGKAYAVAADGLSPVYEKDANNKPTKVQKQEDGLPLYSSSGFYLLSSKDYPAVLLTGAYTRLSADGFMLRLVTPAQLASRKHLTVQGDLGLDLLEDELSNLLSDEHNLVQRYDQESNKRRKRDLSRAKEDAEAEGQVFEGPEYTELAVSKKDGNPFVMLAWVSHDETIHGVPVTRDSSKSGTDGKPVWTALSAEEAIKKFKESDAYSRLSADANQGGGVRLALLQGHSLRTSVSTKKRIDIAITAPPAKAQYGDSVYLLGTLKGWTKGLVSVMHTVHPNFPRADYDSIHYVAACRQAEVGMNKKAAGGWEPPEAPQYNLVAMLLSPC